ncbi:MAG: 3,4-dihydroxy-2-butanone-4-phosphate synthase [Thiotrichales bacterium]|jgi:3,4-dihydroxy 2-butanone 4-phosphate synthase/GTP cyclohydrolase II|nr:3,4-dihydroxy-2-butanone-4-phosphate synthase [Thiotrichales bacterium]MBT3614169.1 3,4-dihydroxy-2-butanone-4-phosphate synthase [Thiotrichales bacterium]MBT3751987.1 3,4-dihydroxy-2-butanone-4-phosphate synthase [Thiotrichales bacterium]MBT3837370.1 3,4-dihydroxy-2-butanone-4-phosphate synthase [Thiotrichales bacterium]MBT4152655.1 3,4-dihydroxy-2-butanone-4-phosphate synthase [Thiotrichales bacterium]
MKLNSPEEIVEDIRQGKMVVLMDDEDRENEGDLIMAATKASTEDINFMARYGRGLICLTLSKTRCEQLDLPLMVQGTNHDLHGTNFTVSIEAAEGVTTGISAADRAKTIQVATAEDATADSIVMPGHVFPLMAQPGGVLTRAGHTEAGCDLARLAGFEPSSVIVEILNEDGSMARRPDLEVFAQKHNLKLGTVADLIEYRIKNEKTIEAEAESVLNTKYGEFKVKAYRESINNEVHLALVKGEIDSEKPIMVRVHMLDTLCDLFSVEGEGCGHTLERDMHRVSQEENGVLLLLRKEEDGRDLVARIQNHQLASSSTSKPKSSKDSGELRDFGVGAQILLDLGVVKMRVLGTPRKMHALSGFGLEMVETVTY